MESVYASTKRRQREKKVRILSSLPSSLAFKSQTKAQNPRNIWACSRERLPKQSCLFSSRNANAGARTRMKSRVFLSACMLTRRMNSKVGKKEKWISLFDHPQYGPVMHVGLRHTDQSCMLGVLIPRVCRGIWTGIPNGWHQIFVRPKRELRWVQYFEGSRFLRAVRNMPLFQH